MKKMNKFSKMLTLMVAMATLMFACVDDDYDRPDIEQIPVGQIYTIQQIKDLYNGSTYKFTDDASVYATVTMDNETDNSYRTFFIQDNTGAIAVFQDVSGGVYIGDSVRIYLKNLVVMQYQKLFQINSVSGDGVNVDDNLIKQGYNNKRSPEDATIQDIKDNMAYYQGRLVKISDVQFVDTDIDKTFADAENLETEERKIQDTYDNQLIVRTSGYATFANSDVPDGSGSIIAIVGQYGETIQLYIRRVSELEMDNERFEITQPPVEGVTSFNVDFENLSDYDDVEITGWQSFAEVGSRLWQAKEFSGNVYAQGSAYNSSDDENIEWLISPPIDFDVNSNEVLTFRSAVAYYTHEAFELLISTDYDGVNYASATWQPLSATIAGSGNSNYAWVNSGDIDLSSYTGIGYIAFKYTGDADQGETGSFIIDDLVLQDKP